MSPSYIHNLTNAQNRRGQCVYSFRDYIEVSFGESQVFTTFLSFTLSIATLIELQINFIRKPSLQRKFKENVRLVFVQKIQDTRQGLTLACVLFTVCCSCIHTVCTLMSSTCLLSVCSLCFHITALIFLCVCCKVSNHTDFKITGLNKNKIMT